MLATPCSRAFCQRRTRQTQVYRRSRTRERLARVAFMWRRARREGNGESACRFELAHSARRGAEHSGSGGRKGTKYVMRREVSAACAHASKYFTRYEETREARGS